MQNKVDWNDQRFRDGADFYTVGYMRRSVADLVETLRSVNVATVLDVRYTPVSMYKPEFSKRNLRDHLTGAGIGYMHMRDLGVPRDIRGMALRDNTRDVIWDWYDQHVASVLNLHAFLNWSDHPIAILCVELDPTACHRHRLALALERHGLTGYDL